MVSCRTVHQNSTSHSWLVVEFVLDSLRSNRLGLLALVVMYESWSIPFSISDLDQEGFDWRDVRNVWCRGVQCVCDIPQQTVRVSSSLSPRTVVELIRQAMGTATLINYVDPMQPTFHTPGERHRYSSYDDSYSYEGRTGYSPAYSAPYNGRSYDNEFRPSSYGGRSGYGSSLY